MVEVVVGMARLVPAFEAPGRERRALRMLQRQWRSSAASSPSSPSSASAVSVSVSDYRVFELMTFLLSPKGVSSHPQAARELIAALARRCESSPKLQLGSSFDWTHTEDLTAVQAGDAAKTLFVVVTYRPTSLLPLSWASARRAVRLVNGVVALVTANAYISTLGGGHFLCRHLDQAVIMARLQMAVSIGLQDPVLESKCRVNLAYNAMQQGRFRRAQRVIEHEASEAERLSSEELRSVCHAASVYLAKTRRLHKELELRHRDPGNVNLHDNFYRQRIVRRAT